MCVYEKLNSKVHTQIIFSSNNNERIIKFTYDIYDKKVTYNNDCMTTRKEETEK